MLLRVMALKLSDTQRFTQRPFGIGTMVPISIPSGEEPCLNIEVNNIDKIALNFWLALIMWSDINVKESTVSWFMLLSNNETWNDYNFIDEFMILEAHEVGGIGNALFGQSFAQLCRIFCQL